ncbi:MAG: hypothetical protein BRD50_08125 [Bacteroidetes bacterium SW_11_45_7]|nr:MAG: hypothetical protein BRD50_08125 [Bacteroidetes bacterium SW_11_45_7]
MKQSTTIRFLLTSLSTALVAAIVIFVMRDTSFLSNIETFSWISLLFFLILSTISFQLNAFTLLNHLKQRFMQIFLATIVGKFLLSIVLIVSYALIANPSTYRFIVPFFVFFLLYKVIEIVFILQLSKESPRSSASQ